MAEKITIDILEIEISDNLGNWLSPEEKYRHQNDELMAKIRKKYRDRWIARQRGTGKRGFDWDETDHPRDADGKFASGGGGESASTEPSTPASAFTSMGSTAKAATEDDARDEFAPPEGGWQAVAEEARDKYLAEHTRVNERTVALKQDLDAAMDAARNFEDAKYWYEEHRPLARDLFAENEPMFEKFVAATSIMKAGSDNVRLAVDAMLNWLGGGRFDTRKDFNSPGIIPAIRDELVKVENDEALTGSKVVPFWQALTGTTDVAPLDRHMQELLFVNTSKSGGTSNKSRADVAQAVLHAMAEKMGWETRQLQAVLWCVQKARNEKGLSAKIWTLQDYLKEREAGIRAALDVVHGKRSFADALSIIAEMADGFANAQALLTLIGILQEDNADEDQNEA
jgi:hypothetical protein